MALAKSDGASGGAGGWQTVAGGMGGIAALYGGPRAGEVQDGWDDFREFEDRRLPRKWLNEGGLRTAGFKAANMDDAIPATNRGFRLLQKMGWKSGDGLGKNRQGRIDPVRLDSNEFKMGLGKNTEYNYYATEATKERLKLDSEFDENEVRERRAAEANREEKIQHEVKKVTREFYCELCDVQYQNMMQMEEHLSSYNHHHKKRFIEMKAMMKNREDVGSTEEREQQMAQREMKKAMKQAAFFASQQAATQQRAEQPVKEEKAVESLESGRRAAVTVSMGGKKSSFGGKKMGKKPKAAMTFSMVDDD